jgi:hypothetical protein
MICKGGYAKGPLIQRSKSAIAKAALSEAMKKLFPRPEMAVSYGDRPDFY